MQADAGWRSTRGPISPCTLAPAPPQSEGGGPPCPTLDSGASPFLGRSCLAWAGPSLFPERVQDSLWSQSKIRPSTGSLGLWAGGLLTPRGWTPRDCWLDQLHILVPGGLGSNPKPHPKLSPLPSCATRQ